MFGVYLYGTSTRIGRIDLRIGYTDNVVLYGGHIGYTIDKEFRGNYYAAKACKLILPIAKENHMDVIWITCNPENISSRKTCEFIKCDLVEIIDLPPQNDQYKRGDRQKCRYRLIIS